MTAEGTAGRVQLAGKTPCYVSSLAIELEPQNAGALHVLALSRRVERGYDAQEPQAS